MLKVARLTDYAIMVMGQLAQEESATARSAHYLSEKTGVPEPTVAKVLKLLSKGGLVISARGAAGGYRLVKMVEQISLAEIITAMDGPISMVACVDGHQGDCELWTTCPTKSGWDRVNSAIKAALEGVKLTEMTVPSCGRKHDFMKGLNADSA